MKESSDQPAGATEIPGSYPAIGIDLDGCIDEAPEFFRLLTHHWPGDVFIITYRSDPVKAKQDVEKFGIRYTEIVLVRSFEQKAVEVVDRNILVYFDDQDEMLMHIPEGRGVFKIRNGGNFCFESRRWLFSALTGKQI